jgi:hypothetical protein
MRKTILALATVGALAGTALPALAWDRDSETTAITGIGTTATMTTDPTGATTMTIIVGRIAIIIGGGGGTVITTTITIGTTTGVTTETSACGW